jgi:hypothetical protein
MDDMNQHANDATGEGRAANKEFELYLTMSVRCSAQIWQDTGDADLAMTVLTRAVYSPNEMPEMDPVELVASSREIGDYVASHPLPPCEICARAGVVHDGQRSLCWVHYSEALMQEFGDALAAGDVELKIGDEPT